MTLLRISGRTASLKPATRLAAACAIALASMAQAQEPRPAMSVPVVVGPSSTGAAFPASLGEIGAQLGTTEHALSPAAPTPVGYSMRDTSYNPVRGGDDIGEMPEVVISMGETRVLPAPNIARIAVGSGDVISAAALDQKEVIVFANKVGSSSLFLWNQDGRYQRVRVQVIPERPTRIAHEIAAFLNKIPNATSSIIADKVIVEGDNLSDSDLLKIEQLAKRYPQIINFTNQIGWEKMVLVDVKVVEFPTSELSEIGLKWRATGGATIGALWGPIRRNAEGYTITDPAGGEIGENGQISPPSALTILSAINMGLNAELNLLLQNGKATMLAQPQLSARNGATASFHAGGEVPYVVSNITGTTVEFKNYGIRLNITPQVDRQGNIRATIGSEVSAIDYSLSTAFGPALRTRKTETEFNVHNGETIVLSGLLSRETGTDIDKVPLLGDIPILGNLFRSERFQNKETELVVFVTPTVIDSHTPALVDRVEQTQARISQELGGESNLVRSLPPLEPSTANGPASAPVPLPNQSSPASHSAAAKPNSGPAWPPATSDKVITVEADDGESSAAHDTQQVALKTEASTDAADTSAQDDLDAVFSFMPTAN